MMVGKERTGSLRAAEERILEFGRGLFGFEGVGSFVMRRVREGSPLRLLQAAADAGPAFAVIDPFLLDPGYRFELTSEDRAALEWTGETDLAVMVIVGIPEDPREMTANMQGPIVIHSEKGIGRQVLLSGDEYPARLRIMDAIKQSRDGFPASE